THVEVQALVLERRGFGGEEGRVVGRCYREGGEQPSNCPPLADRGLSRDRLRVWCEATRMCGDVDERTGHEALRGASDVRNQPFLDQVSHTGISASANAIGRLTYRFIAAKAIIGQKLLKPKRGKSIA